MKKILSLCASVILIIFSVVALNNSAVVEAADNLVLLENRHPGYWKYLSPDKMTEVATIPGFEDIALKRTTSGNVMSDFTTGNISGISITEKDGIINFKGRATEDTWPNINGKINAQDIANGTYFISLGEHKLPESIDSYIEGYKDGKQQIIAGLKSDKWIYFDSTQYDFYKITIGIRNGEYINFSLTPKLIKISDQDLTSKDLVHMAVWKNVPVEIPNREKKLFMHSLSRYSSYYKVYICHTDGSLEEF